MRTLHLFQASSLVLAGAGFLVLAAPFFGIFFDIEILNSLRLPYPWNEWILAGVFGLLLFYAGTYLFIFFRKPHVDSSNLSARAQLMRGGHHFIFWSICIVALPLVLGYFSLGGGVGWLVLITLPLGAIGVLVGLATVIIAYLSSEE